MIAKTVFASPPRWVPFVLAAVLDLPMIFLGYGTDGDAIGVVYCGRRLLEEHIYRPSRYPGFLVFEVATGILYEIGGSILTNLGVLAMSLASLALFLRICRRCEIPHATWLAILLVLHPVYWINSTCTMDYNYALAFLLAGLACLIEGHLLIAAVVMGLSIGTRLSSFIACGVFLLYAWSAYPNRRGRVLACGGLTAIVGACCYAPAYHWAGHTLRFLQVQTGDPKYWPWYMTVGRWGYKNLYFWGLPAAALLATMLVVCWRNRRNYFDARWAPLALVALGVVAGYEALFMRYPIEAGYLVPILPFLLILLGIGLKDRPGWFPALAVGLVLMAAVKINIARPDHPNFATASQFGLWVEPGYVVDDLEQRWQVRDRLPTEVFFYMDVEPIKPK